MARPGGLGSIEFPSTSNIVSASIGGDDIVAIRAAPATGLMAKIEMDSMSPSVIIPA